MVYFLINSSIKNTNLILTTLILFVIELMPMFIIMKVTKKHLRYIGITKKNLFRSILLGIIVSLPFIIYILNKNVYGISLKNTVERFIFDLFVVFDEEIIYRGYLQHNVSALFKHKWTGIILTGVMFSLAHVPKDAMLSNAGVIVQLRRNLFDFTYIAYHIIFSYLYTRFDNIAAPTIAHLFLDLY